MSKEKEKSDLITTREAAKVLGVSDARVRQMIYADTIPAQKIGGANLIKRSDLANVVTHRKAGRPPKEKK
jgi:excisionase family DNA binding protein